MFCFVLETSVKTPTVYLLEITKPFWRVMAFKIWQRDKYSSCCCRTILSCFLRQVALRRSEYVVIQVWHGCISAQVCFHYNRGEGLHGSCRFNTSCTKLHICQHFLQGDCKFGDTCKRAHQFNVNERKQLQNISQENIDNIFQIYRNRFIITAQGERQGCEFPGRECSFPPLLFKSLPEREMHLYSHALVSPAVPQAVGSATQQSLGSKPERPTGPKPLSDADRNEICLFFIRTNCSFKGNSETHVFVLKRALNCIRLSFSQHIFSHHLFSPEKCTHVHWHLPYRWQVLALDGVTWSDLPNMEEIERAYCDPRHNSSTHQPSQAAKNFSILYFSRWWSQKVA